METAQSGTDETSQNRGAGGWTFPLLLAVVLLALVGIFRLVPQGAAVPHTNSPTQRTPSPQPTGETASLVIDFGNGVRKSFAALPWHEQMTVAELMQAAREYEPAIVYSQIGEGESGFLSSLEGVANEGAGGRNWLYQVDGQHAHVSFCLEKIAPGAQVLWTFTDELYNGELSDTSEVE